MSRSSDIKELREDVDQLIRIIGGSVTYFPFIGRTSAFPERNTIQTNDGLIGELRTKFHELLDYLGLELQDRFETPWKIVKKEKDHAKANRLD